METAVVVTFRPTGTRAEASERRSQDENRRVALRRLRLRLAVEYREPLDAEPSPSDVWQLHRAGRQLRIGRRHEDYPALLAEALDWIVGRSGDVAAAAHDLGVSSSQLTRLVRHHPPAWQLVQSLRLQSGLRPLK